MAPAMRQLSFLFLIAMVAACTNRSGSKPTGTPYSAQSVSQTVARIGDFAPEDQPEINAFQMFQRNGSLFLTGKPFGFMRWELSATPESPSITANASKFVDLFSNPDTLGSWLVDFYASTALSTKGNFAYTSGTAGLSVIDISQPTLPKEVERYPRPDEDGNPLADAAFVYRAIVPHPKLNIMYGFSEQDYLYIIDTSAAPKLTISQALRYPGSNTCCVRGAAFAENKIYVAMRSRLWVYDVNASGGLSSPREITGINAEGVVATNKYVYIRHNAENGSSTGLATNSGILYYNFQGARIGRLDRNPAGGFSISPDDRYLYTNEDGKKIKIYRILSQ